MTHATLQDSPIALHKCSHRPLNGQPIGKVCFIMPAYNVEQYLATAIESIQQQTITDWELIIIDDCSTDRTAALAHTYAATDSRIRLISTKKNSGGAYEPRRIGILATQAYWIAPLDADDWVNPDYLSELLKKQQSSQADIVYPVMYRMPGNIRLKPAHKYTRQKAFKGSEAVCLSLPEWEIGAGGGIIHRELYIKGFDEITHFFSCRSSFIDEALTRLLLHNAPVVAFAETPYYYRVNPDSVTNQSPLNQLKGYAPMILELLDYFRTHQGETAEITLRTELRIFRHINQQLSLLNKKFRPHHKEDTTPDKDFQISREEHKEILTILQQLHSSLKLPLLRKHLAPKELLKSFIPLPLRRHLL